MPTEPPLYRAVESALRERIVSGALRAGERLPTEVALCDVFGVSRITVRRALAVLESERLIARRRGSGTVVADLDAVVKSLTLTGFIEDAIPLNRYAVTSDAAVATPPEIARLLAERGAVVEPRMRRVVAINRIARPPLSVTEFFFPAASAGRIAAEDFARATTIVRLLESRGGPRLSHADQLVEAVVPPSRVARALGLDGDTPVLRTLRIFVAKDGSTMQAVRIHHHPTGYRFMARLEPQLRPPPPAD